MADNGNSTSAKNSLGQLFVDFGMKGLSGLLKGLNTVSAQFLLTKNAAQQALSPVVNFYKNTGQNIIDLQKASLMTNIPLKQMQELQRWSKINNISFDGYINQVSKLQQAVNQFKLGGSQYVKGFQILGIDPSSVDVEKNPLALMDLIKQRILELYKAGGGARAVTGLSMLGLEPDMIYTFTQANEKIDETLNLNEQQLKNLKDQKLAMNELSDAWTQFLSKALATKDVVEITKDLVKVVKQLFTWVNKIEGSYQRIKNLFNSKAVQTYLELNPTTAIPKYINDKFWRKQTSFDAGLDNIKAFSEGTKENISKTLPDVQRQVITSLIGGKTANFYVTNNNQLNSIEDISQMSYLSKQQAQYNNAKFMNGSNT